MTFPGSCGSATVVSARSWAGKERTAAAPSPPLGRQRASGRRAAPLCAPPALTAAMPAPCCPPPPARHRPRHSGRTRCPAGRAACGSCGKGSVRERRAREGEKRKEKHHRRTTSSSPPPKKKAKKEKKKQQQQKSPSHNNP